MKITKHFEQWLDDKDSHGTPLLGEWEKKYIINRYKRITNIKIVKGDIKKNKPNQIIIDITHLTPKNFQPNKNVLITLAHFIRPCPCGCHKLQWQCYINDCQCCMGECT
jgi:hypothetical protein